MCVSPNEPTVCPRMNRLRTHVLDIQKQLIEDALKLNLERGADCIANEVCEARLTNAFEMDDRWSSQLIVAIIIIGITGREITFKHWTARSDAGVS